MIKIRSLLMFLALPLIAACASPIDMAKKNTHNNVIVIKHDTGGLIADRIVYLEEIKARQSFVRIEADKCISACTLYLGLENVCTLPETEFMFHGPAYSSGFFFRIKPGAAAFENSSEIVAKYYPPYLRERFMTTYRHQINSYTTIKGRELIENGVVADCANVKG